MSGGKHFAAVIRHGEGGDHVPDFTYPNRHDPPLTLRGMNQALATGEFLKWYFTEFCYDFDKIIIECSPFLRCMMSAGQIADALEVNDVEINYRASEILVREFKIKGKLKTIFKSDPMTKIEFARYGYDFEGMKAGNLEYRADGYYFPGAVSFVEGSEYKEEIHATYPEAESQCRERGLELFEGMNRRIQEESEGNAKGVCYLIVAHGMWVDELAHIQEYLQSNEAVSSEIFASLEDEQNHCRTKLLESLATTTYGHPAYCSMSGFKVDEGAMEVVFSRYEEHIKFKEVRAAARAGAEGLRPWDVLVDLDDRLVPEPEAAPERERYVPSPPPKKRRKKRKRAADQATPVPENQGEILPSPKDLEDEKVYQSYCEKVTKDAGPGDTTVMVVRATSAGFEAGNMAEILINNVPVVCEANENGHDRGLHLVVINSLTGAVVTARVFDSHHSGRALRDYVEAAKKLPDGHIVVVACKDDCVSSLPAAAELWLAELGSKEVWKLAWRQGYA